MSPGPFSLEELGDNRWWARLPQSVRRGLVAASRPVTAVLDKVSTTRRFQLFGDFVVHVSTDERVVALTFDDGPNQEDAPAIRAALNSQAVHATFFLNGADIAEFPEIARELLEDGHELANHGWSHKRLTFIPRAEIYREVDDTSEAIRTLGYHSDLRFRPPYGRRLVMLPYLLRQRGMLLVGADVAPENFDLPEGAQTGQDLASKIIEEVRPGSIILLHPWSGRTHAQDAIELTIAGLRARGYEFLTVDQLLKRGKAKHKRRRREAVSTSDTMRESGSTTEGYPAP